MEVAGVELAGAGEGATANIGDSAFSAEALIKISTNLSDSDRRFRRRSSKGGVISATS